MSDLIKREDAVEQTFNESNYEDKYNILTEVRDNIRNIPTVDAIPIPKNATNGDVIRNMFLNAEIRTIDDTVYITMKGAKEMEFWLVWWNTPYAEGE